MKSLKLRLAKRYYQDALSENDEDIKFHLLFETVILLSQASKEASDSNRQAIRRLIEKNLTAFECDVDFENEILDVYYNRPVFNDLLVEQDKDVYYYEDFNTNKSFKTNDDYVLSIRNFQKIVDDSDIISFYMSMYKIYECLFDKEEYSDYETKLLKASNYLLLNALNNLFDQA